MKKEQVIATLRAHQRELRDRGVRHAALLARSHEAKTM